MYQAARFEHFDADGVYEAASDKSSGLEIYCFRLLGPIQGR